MNDIAPFCSLKVKEIGSFDTQASLFSSDTPNRSPWLTKQ